MNKTFAAIQDLRKVPLVGDVFQLGENEYVTVLSISNGEVRYVPGAVEVGPVRDAPEDLMRRSIAMPYKTFRKWLATIAAGRRVDTPPPA